MAQSRTENRFNPLDFETDVAIGLGLPLVHPSAGQNNPPVTGSLEGGDSIVGTEVEVLPIGPVLSHHKPRNLVVALVVLATDQIAIVVYTTESGIFSRCRDPSLWIDSSDLGVE